MLRHRVLQCSYSLNARYLHTMFEETQKHCLYCEIHFFMEMQYTHRHKDTHTLLKAIISKLLL